MRLLAAAVAVVALVAAASAEPESARDRISALSLRNPVIGWVGRVYVACVRAQAKALAERPEPKLTDADWKPSKDRPTVEQEAATAISSCSFEEEGLALEVPAAELKTLKAMIERDAMETIRWTREERDTLRRE
jgi:hypothetical protein